MLNFYLFGIYYILDSFLVFLYSFLQSHSHTVNLLTAIPLQCLDVLLMVPLQPNSEQCQGVNMDCVHTLLMFMERRLDSVSRSRVRDLEMLKGHGRIKI